MPASLLDFMRGGIIQEVVTTAASLLTETGNVMTQAFTIIWSLVTGNPILVVSAGAGLLTIGFRIFRKAKRASRL